MVRRNSTGHVVFMAMGIMAVFTVFVDLVCLHQMEAGTAVTVTTNDPIQLGQQTPRISAIMTSSLSRPADGSKDKDKDDKQYGRAGVVRRLQDAGVTSLTYSIIHQLPTWKQITELYGEHPVIVNEDSCTLYQSRVPPKRRMLGSAGMFSTGTNLVTTLLKKNCKIPERVQWYGMNASRELHGIRWQVPWGKHTQQQYRDKHATEQAKAIVKDDLLPVVTIRHPIQWMQSMCRNPYTAQWSHKRNQCPNLRHHSQEEQDDDEAKAWNPVTVKYGAGTEHYHSLAHLYNDWYHGYTEHAKYPWIMIRMEDLIFHTHETIQRVCDCAGGRLVNPNRLEYTVESAKADSPGHDTSTGLVEAWIRYSRPPTNVTWSLPDFLAARDSLDPTLLKLFHYPLFLPSPP